MKKSTRRSFLKYMALTPLISVAPYRSIMALGKAVSSPLAPVAIDPVTVMTVSKTALDVISSFSGSKDSPLAAMLRYQSGMLKEISSQLNEIQDALVNVQNTLDALPSKMREELNVQYRRELIAEVRGAAHRYNTNVLEPSISNPDILNNENVRNEIENIVNIADQKLSALKSIPGNIGPESCMVAPLAMSLEVAGRINLNFPQEVIRGTVLKYDAWFDQMLSNKAGSILDHQKQAIQNHESALSALDDNDLAKRYGLENYKLSGSQVSGYANDPFVIFSPFGPAQMRGVAFDHKSGTTRGDKLENVTVGIYARSAKLKSELDQTLGAYTIKFEEPLVMIGTNRAENRFLKPKAGEYCYVYGGGAYFDPSRKEMIDLVHDGHKPWSVDNVSRAKIEEAVKKANLERARLSLCSLGFTVATNTKNRIQEYLTLL